MRGGRVWDGLDSEEEEAAEMRKKDRACLLAADNKNRGNWEIFCQGPFAPSYETMW